VSFKGNNDLRWPAVAAALALAVAAAPAVAQYPGQVSKDAKKSPELRAVAVLEWTGELGKPKACRIVPITVLDEGHLQDGGIYLARPQPLALAGEVEYQLEENGKTIGLFDIENSGQEQGSWVGYGKWKAKPDAPRPAPVVAKIEDDDDDKPVLHRKKHLDEPNSGKAAGSGASDTRSTDTASTSAPPSDPDRPVLKKKDESAGSTSTSSSTPGSSTTSSTTTAKADDPDRPKLNKKDDTPQPNVLAAEGDVESLPGVSDPDRPRLKRGKSNGGGPLIAPSLMGMPPDMEQAVAVSDAKDHPDHPWTFSWSNPGDEAKMKSALEDMARDALGLKAPPAPAAPAKKNVATTRKSLLKPAQPPAPPPLADEQFRVFELAYGSGATMVLTAHTDGPRSQMKFVTLIAQPDLYGAVRVLFKSVTDGSHLDVTPRMRLVDAVDALADNRGELLFELRGDTQRQFALYRVFRGQAEQLFVTAGGEWGNTASN